MVHLKIKQDSKETRIKLMDAKKGALVENLNILQSKSNVLTSLLGDLNTRAKDLKVDVLSDAETFKILRYWAKQMAKLIETKNISEYVITSANTSKAIYESYLPKLMTRGEMQEILKVHNFKSIGECMQFFRTYHKDAYSQAQLAVLFNNEFANGVQS